MEEITFTYATKLKRLGSFIIDAMFVFVLWYFMTRNDLEKVDTLMKTLDPTVEGSLDVFVQEIFKMVVAFDLKLVFANVLYYALVPALIGKGKTLGKFFFKLSMVDKNTISEIPPIRLLLREAVGRGVVEVFFIIPGIVSAFMVLFDKKGRALHDRIASTIVVSDQNLWLE